MNSYQITTFTGTFNHTLDAKGRFSIPSIYREILKTQYTEELMIFQSVGENYLISFPMSEWKRVESRVAGLNIFDPVEREVRRLILSTVRYCPLDKAGRILMPSEHRVHAQIDKDVTLRGDINGFEIWNTENWSTVSDDLKDNAEIISCAAKIFSNKSV